MSAVPLNDTPPIFLAVCNCVADDALPLNAPVNVVAFILVEVRVVNPDNVLVPGLDDYYQCQCIDVGIHLD